MENNIDKEINKEADSFSEEELSALYDLMDKLDKKDYRIIYPNHLSEFQYISETAVLYPLLSDFLGELKFHLNGDDYLQGYFIYLLNFPNPLPADASICINNICIDSCYGKILDYGYKIVPQLLHSLYKFHKSNTYETIMNIPYKNIDLEKTLNRIIDVIFEINFLPAGSKWYLKKFSEFSGSKLKKLSKIEIDNTYSCISTLLYNTKIEPGDIVKNIKSNKFGIVENYSSSKINSAVNVKYFHSKKVLYSLPNQLELIEKGIE